MYNTFRCTILIHIFYMFDMESSVNCHASNSNKQNHVFILKLVLLSCLLCTTELHFQNDGCRGSFVEHISDATTYFMILKFLIHKDSTCEARLFLNDIVKWFHYLSKWLSPKL